MNNSKSKYYSGIRALPYLTVFRFSMLKYLLLRKKYPEFTISRSSGGILKTNELQKKMGMCKFTRFNGHNYYSLTVPHWPSDAFDNMVANGGLNISAAGTPLKKQIDNVILGITRRCSYKCSHCYEYFNLGIEDIVPAERWVQVIKDLQATGVSIITLSGGEPMLRYDALLNILKCSDHSLSDFHIHTTGYEVTAERCTEMKKAGLNAAGIGLDDFDPERNDAFRGFRGAFGNAINAINLFRDAGIFTYINFCPTPVLMHPGNLQKYLEMVKELNAGYIRWLEPKPCGRYSDAGPEIMLSNDEKELLLEYYFKINTSSGYRDFPPVSYEAFFESPENMGCMMGGNSLLYIDSKGNVEPCVFLPVGFGNIMKEDIADILKKLKKIIHSPVHKPCPSAILSGRIKELRNGSDPVSYELLAEEFNDMYKEP